MNLHSFGGCEKVSFSCGRMTQQKVRIKTIGTFKMLNRSLTKNDEFQKANEYTNVHKEIFSLMFFPFFF